MRKLVAVLGILSAAAWVLRSLGFRFGRPPQPPPVPPQHELYVVDMGGNRIFCFEIRSNGVVASTPWRIIDGFNSPIVELVNPFDIAVTPAGEMWVANLGSTPGSSSDASITIYDPNAVGAVAPTFKIFPIADAFGPPIANPVALVWRNAPANILILDATRTEVTEYTKSQQSTASVFGLGTPGGLALTASATLYISDQTPGENAIRLLNLQPNVFGQSASVGITGPLTGLNNPAHLALDTHNNIYVVNRGTMHLNMQDASVAVFPAGATGNVAPVQYIRGPNTQLVEPYGIAVDQGGRIFVTKARSVLVFAAGASGNIAPEQVIEHPEFANLIGIEVR
ncbi:MAG: hypothetical protein M3496_11765 [Pseudomonadota bacterium]|nr:hypothetical protein [Pseudomonadota bacterium]